MKRILLATLVVAFSVPAIALAQAPTKQHRIQYERAYGHAAHLFGRRTPGRDIVRHGLAHGKLSDAAVVKSLNILRRMFDPVPRPAYAALGTILSYNGPTVPVAQPGQSQTPSSGLAACIISRESGGNSQAVNPSGHMGEAQWDEQTWLSQGGGKYASTPLGASAAQQTAILNQALANGQSGAWRPYDGC